MRLEADLADFPRAFLPAIRRLIARAYLHICNVQNGFYKKRPG